MSTDLGSRLEAAFAERAATTPITATRASDEFVGVVGEARRGGKLLLAGCAVVVASLVVGLVALRSEPIDRVVSSPGFDGATFPVEVGRFVSLGLSAQDGWARTSVENAPTGSSVSYCRSIDAVGRCGEVVGSTGARYERDGHRVEIVNLFGPEGTTSVYWQGARAGTPTTVRGHDAGYEVSQGDDGRSVALAWSEDPQHHVLIIDHSSTTTPDGALDIAGALSPTDLTVAPRLIEIASIDTDDHDRTSFGPGLLSLVAGRIDGRACVALLGFNGNEKCDSGFDYGDGPAPAVAGRSPGGAGIAVVAAILPPQTRQVIIDRYESSSMTFEPISVAGLDETFILASVGAAFPTMVRAIDANGSEIAAHPVDPLFGDGFARGSVDGRTWALTAADPCVLLTDVYSSSEECTDPTSLLNSAITVGTATPALQFGRAGSDVQAVEVQGVAYPVVAGEDGERYWIAPLTGLPIPIGEDGLPLDQPPLGTPAPDTVFCVTARQAVELDNIELLNSGSLRSDPALESHQQAAINAALNLRLIALTPDPNALASVIDDICPETET